MNQRKLILLIASTVLIIGLSACGNKDKEPETTASETEQTELETEGPVDLNDLFNTLDWQGDEEKIQLLRDEVVTGYDISIGSAFYVTETNREESEDGAAESESPYNILPWKYSDYNNTEYLLLEYSYSNDNYKVVFYKDSHANTNIAELYINNEKQEKEAIKKFSDSIFLISEPEPETVEETEPETTKPEPTKEEPKQEERDLTWDGLYWYEEGDNFTIEGSTMYKEPYGAMPLDISGNEANVPGEYLYELGSDSNGTYVEILSGPDAGKRYYRTSN